MTRQGSKISKRFLFVYFMLGGLIFLFTPATVTGKLQLAYARMFRGPLAAGRVATLAARTATRAETGRAKSYEELAVENRQLANIAANREAHLDAAEQQIADLQQVRSNPDWKRMVVVEASVLSDLGQGQSELLINRGQNDRLAVGQFVLGDFSVIGTISAVLNQTAKVRLITDPASRIPVRIAQMKAQGIMTGNGPNTAAVQVPSRHKAQKARKGDRVYALKAPGYPEIPFVTAVVVDCKPDENPVVLNISVQPVCDIANLKGVHVIVPGR